VNTFNITLATLTDEQAATGCSLSFRGSAEGQVEIWVRVPKARKGEREPQFDDVCLGRVMVANLTMTIAAVQTLTGGHGG